MTTKQKLKAVVATKGVILKLDGNDEEKKKEMNCERKGARTKNKKRRGSGKPQESTTRASMTGRGIRA